MTTAPIEVVRRDYRNGHSYEIVRPEIGKVDSATTIVRAIVNKADALGIWHAKQAVEGLHLLAKRYPDEDLLAHAPADLWDWLKRERLTGNDRMSDAGTRGTAVHDAMEAYAKDGALPNPDRAHPVDRGYIAAGRAFLEAVQPEITGSEVVVGSAEHRFAGTFDAEMTVDPERVAWATGPGRHPAYVGGAVNLSGPAVLADYKTSRGVYLDHHLQLAIYEVARQEMQRPATDERMIVHLRSDGKFGLYVGRATREQALAAVTWFHALRDLEALLKEGD